MLMLQIAGGVVIGGIVLYFLYEFREEIADFLVYPLRVIAAIAAIVLVGFIIREVYRGFWILANHPAGISTDAENRSVGVAALAVVATI